MTIKEKMYDNVAVIELKGKLMGGPETTELHDKVKEIIAKGSNKVVIDLGKVKWMNSSGLGALMGAMTSLRNAEGDLKLANVTEKVESLFMITKLITIFETHNSIDSAVAGFSE